MGRKRKKILLENVHISDAGAKGKAITRLENGLVLFGSHTSANKVSIENSNFKALSVKNLADLDVDTVMQEIKSKLN